MSWNTPATGKPNLGSVPLGTWQAASEVRRHVSNSVCECHGKFGSKLVAQVPFQPGAAALVMSGQYAILLCAYSNARRHSPARAIAGRARLLRTLLQQVRDRVRGACGGKLECLVNVDIALRY